MKFWSLVLLVLFLFLPAGAYAEQGRGGATTLLPGDQNTNLHRLNAFGEFTVKKLKKIDQALGDQKNAGKNISWNELNNLISDDQQENEKILQKIAADTDGKLKNLQNLVVKQDDLFKKARNLKKSSISDQPVVAMLRTQLQGERP